MIPCRVLLQASVVEPFHLQCPNWNSRSRLFNLGFFALRL